MHKTYQLCVFIVCVCVRACTHTHPCEGHRRTKISCTITLHLIPLWKGLSLDLELYWQPELPTKAWHLATIKSFPSQSKPPFQCETVRPFCVYRGHPHLKSGFADVEHWSSLFSGGSRALWGLQKVRAISKFLIKSRENQIIGLALVLNLDLPCRLLSS